MKLSTIIAMAFRRTPKAPKATAPVRRYKGVTLVKIPNCVRKRFGGAEK